MSDAKQPERPILAVSFPLCGNEIEARGMDESLLVEFSVAICRDHGEVFDSHPNVILLETIRKSADGEGKYIRQTGGSGNYGHVKLRLDPGHEGSGLEFVNAVPETSLPGEYAAAAEMGVRKAALGGVLHGLELVDLRATLFDGSYHATDSNPTAFQIAGGMAFQEAAKRANPVLLEPVMAVNVTAPESETGMICLDISLRRGRIESIETLDGSISLAAKIPLRETLRSSQHGSFRYPMQFARYEPVSNPRDEFGDDAFGAGVRNPQRPNLDSGRAAADLYFALE